MEGRLHCTMKMVEQETIDPHVTFYSLHWTAMDVALDAQDNYERGTRRISEFLHKKGVRSGIVREV